MLVRFGVVCGDVELDKWDGMVVNVLEGNGLLGWRYCYLYDCCKKLYVDNSIVCEDFVWCVGICWVGVGMVW